MGIVLTWVIWFAQAQAADITIGIIGDQTGTTNLDQAYYYLGKGVNALKEWPSSNLDVVIHSGDFVESTGTEEQIKAEFQQGTAWLNQLPVAWYMAAGDHDVNPPAFQQDSPDRNREELFQKLYSSVNPSVTEHLYYSFDVKGYHFIALYSEEHLDTDPRWGNVFFSQISNTQYQWLQNDLQTHANAKGIIVFLHQPMWYNWMGWSRVHQLLKQYQVSAVVAGHFHYNQQDNVLDGIQYLVVGATGGMTKTGNQNSGDLQQVSILELNGRQPSFTMIPLSPFIQTKWTERSLMDRLQAIDQMLGNLWDFSGKNKVYLQNGQLVDGCGSNQPAKLQLTNIGNAIEIPVNFVVNATLPSSVTISKTALSPTLCLSDQSQYGCTLKKSAGIAVTNTSMVDTASDINTLWSGTLALNGTPPNENATIELQVIMSFNDSNQNYMLYKSVSTQVTYCH
jgi:predicted phosphohydrolase